MDAPELTEIGVVNFGRDFAPLPSLRPDRLRERLELLGHEAIEKLAVREIAFLLGIEEVAHDAAAGRLIGRSADKAGAPVRAFDG